MAILAKDLIQQFQTMYQEKWRYEPNGASRGSVDCSGAFVYAFRQYGAKIAHGSNSIGRNYIVELLPISRAEPGMAAFKLRSWTEDQKTNRWYMTEPGDLHHIGLVDEDANHVLNAKGQAYGFCRDVLSEKNGWDFVARLKAVEYNGGGGGSGMEVIISGGNPNAPIRMRSKPSTSGSIVAEIPQGSSAELLGSEGEWSNIRYSGKEGWTMTVFVHSDSPSEDTVQVPRAELKEFYEKIGSWLK